MSLKKYTPIIVAVAAWAVCATTHAQGILPGGKTIGERLDNLGKSVFGSPKTESPAKPSAAGTSDQSADDESAIADNYAQTDPYQKTTRAGTNRVQIYRTDGTPRSSTVSSSGTQNLPYSNGSSIPRVSMPSRQSAAANDNDSILDPNTYAPNAAKRTANSPRAMSADQTDSRPIIAKPLHERLSQTRESAFGTANSSSSSTTASDSTDAPTKTTRTPTPARRPTTATPSVSDDVPSEPAVAPTPRSVRSSVGGSVSNPTARPTPAKRPTVTEDANRAVGRPVIVQRALPQQSGQRQANPDEDDVANDSSDSSKSDASAPAGKVAAGKTSGRSGAEDGVLFTRRGPALSVETIGPRKISVGKESAYEVSLINSGDVGAEEVVVFVSLPEWAEVLGAEASAGATQLAAAGQANAPFVWKVGQIEAKSKEKLVLRIVPRQSRPFDLAVRWDYRPIASQAMIEVQEPKLEMRLEGPREVFYGKKETYRLKLLNSGTGGAEGLSIKLTPEGAGDNSPATYQLGALNAGEDRTIEVELTAKQAGTLAIQVEAKGEAGIHAELSEKVLVRRAGMDIAVDGPRLQYVGANANYTIRVRNPGNAPAKNVTFVAALPVGVKYLGGIETAQADANSNKVEWTLDNLNPETEQVFNMKCALGSQGPTRIDVAVTAEDDISALAGVSTNVEAVAKLALDVSDPSGPILVGDETIYEVRIRNRGTKDAENVEVVGYFSRGIEPTNAEGASHRIQPGQISFSPIPTLAPGTETVLKIFAKANNPGNHVFRAEVHCKSIGSRLVTEKNTLYYQDALAARDAAPAASSPAPAPAANPNNKEPEQQLDRYGRPMRR